MDIEISIGALPRRATGSALDVVGLELDNELGVIALFTRASQPVCTQPISWLLALIAVMCLTPAGTCWAQRESAAFVTRFSRIDEVIEKWSPERQLFVQGNIGVGDAQLQGLAEWLRTNGPHWTIVLMETARGQDYKSAQGDRSRDMDAVEAALGIGLSNRTNFGKLVNAETNESDGAVFVLFLQERKFSYFASDAQDTRDLGEAHWVDELDQSARRAMRSGGRIVDAVKDTVKSINDRLNRVIAAEKNAQAQKAMQRQRMVIQVRNELAI